MSILRDNIKHLQTIHPDVGQGLSTNPTLLDLENLCAKTGYDIATLFQFNLSALQLPWGDIKFIFLDVDGVLTEGGMFYTEEGDEFKRFETKDGMAIKEAIKQGIEFGIISSGVNKAIIQHRADMFGIKRVYVGAEQKVTIAEKWLTDMDLDWNQIGYIGDDINDLKMFDKVAIAACPADASIPNKSAASFVLQSTGGNGCAREFLRYLPLLKAII